MSGFLRDEGYEVKMFNLLDMENSDAWNCLSEIEHNKDLVQSIVEVIIKNTSNANERQDSWEKAELNLPKGHPALPPYGIFKLANRQIWSNNAIGLGNRLSVFQNPLVDKITSYNEIDLTLPGQRQSDLPGTQVKKRKVILIRFILKPVRPSPGRRDGRTRSGERPFWA